MSVRSLFEFNHDQTHIIEDNPQAFVRELVEYLRTGSEREVENLEHFGLRFHGQRHHAEPYRIKWGACESPPSSDIPKSRGPGWGSG